MPRVEAVDKLIEQGLPHLPEKTRQFAMDGYSMGFVPKERLFDRAYFDELFPIYKVSIHEAGHERVIKGNGDDVTVISAIARGNTLGFTSWVPNSAHSEEQNLGNAVAASHGGEAAEELFGERDHPGSESDRGHEKLFATLRSGITGRNVGNILSEGRSKARSFIFRTGRRFFVRRAWTLALAGIIV